MTYDNAIEFPLIPKEFWEQPKEKVRIQNILVSDGGAGQNFMLKLICDSLDLPLFSEKWPFNEYNVGYPSGVSGCVFAQMTIPFSSWFNNATRPVTYEAAQAGVDSFKRQVRWNQPWVKTHMTPIQMFELFDVEYDRMIIVDQNSCRWFFRLLATIKQKCQNNMIDGRQFRIKHILDKFQRHLTEMPESDLLYLEFLSKEIAINPRFNRFFTNNSPMAWQAAMVAEMTGVGAAEGAARTVEILIRECIDKENKARQEKVDRLNKEFLIDKENVWFFQYDQFFFDLDFQDCPAFSKTSKEEVRLYSLENIDIVRKFIKQIPGYNILLDQLDEWEERCWNA